MGVDLWVRNNVADAGNTTMKPELSINLVRRFYYTYYDNLICAWKFQGSWNTTFELFLRLVNAVESISLILFSWLTSEAPVS